MYFVFDEASIKSNFLVVEIVFVTFQSFAPTLGYSSPSSIQYRLKELVGLFNKLLQLFSSLQSIHSDYSYTISKPRSSNPL